jgi:hypothetical protein
MATCLGVSATEGADHAGGGIDAVIARAGFAVDVVTEAARKETAEGVPEAHRSAPPGAGGRPRLSNRGCALASTREEGNTFVVQIGCGPISSLRPEIIPQCCIGATLPPQLGAPLDSLGELQGA